MTAVRMILSVEGEIHTEVRSGNVCMYYINIAGHHNVIKKVELDNVVVNIMYIFCQFA